MVINIGDVFNTEVKSDVGVVSDIGVDSDRGVDSDIGVKSNREVESDIAVEIDIVESDIVVAINFGVISDTGVDSDIGVDFDVPVIFDNWGRFRRRIRSWYCTQCLSSLTVLLIWSHTWSMHHGMRIVALFMSSVKEASHRTMCPNSHILPCVSFRLCVYLCLGYSLDYL